MARVSYQAALKVALMSVLANLLALNGISYADEPGYRLKVFGAKGNRKIAQALTEDPYTQPGIVYVSWLKNKKDPRTVLFNAEAWRDGKVQVGDSVESMTDGNRYNYLLQFYYANTRETSRKGNRHIACFTGSPQAVIEQLFAGAPIKTEADPEESVKVTVTPANSIRYLVGDLEFTYSTDKFMMGIAGTALQTNRKGEEIRVDFHFRLPSCNLPGKSTMIDAAVLDRKPAAAGTSAATIPNPPVVDIETFAKDTTPDPGREPAQARATGMNVGFENTDPVAGLDSKTPSFELRGDYENASFSETKDRPWKGMDLRSLRGSEDFSILMLDYFMDKMVNQNTSNPDMNGIAAKNADRYWCHMPWMNQGASGREGIHGLTKERDLIPSEMYLSNLKRNDPNKFLGSNWGVSYYNGKGCETLGRIFGGSGSRNRTMKIEEARRSFPNGSQGLFEDGTAVVKVLFTTANFPDVRDAFKWSAHVTTTKGSNARSVNDVRLVQIDIAVRDSTLKGARKDLDYWVMTSYYFDSGYRSKYKTRGIPSGWGKMRPQGVQLGLGTPAAGDTLMISGAIANGHEGRLNGPADNPKGSCMSCHATAGMEGVGMVPGFMVDSSYAPLKSEAVDFSQQLAMARRNFETRKR